MNPQTTNIYELTDQLLAVLDEDIRHLTAALERLDSLRGLTIKRDEAGLQHLLETIRVRTARYASIENRREQLRTQFAAQLGSPLEKTDLTLIARALTGEKSQQIKQRQAQLADLVQKVNAEHAATAMLLAECSRFNQQILNSILRTGTNEGTTYSRQGEKNHNRTAGLMNMRL